MTCEMPRKSSSNLINRRRVKMYLLDSAKKHRFHKFTSVKTSTLERLEGELRLFCDNYIKKIPSKGKRL
jgi:hypothetical protein